MVKKRTTYPQEFLEYIEQITNKRARIVIDHIIKYGFITTEDLEKKYGYNHPPRAARDVRELGIPLDTFTVKSESGRSIAAYKFGDITNIHKERLKGRLTIPKDFKSKLYERFKGRCCICNGEFEERYLQIDHRVPYQISGDSKEDRKLDNYMLVCGSCNRAKSWSCEHCKNWEEYKKPALCMECYWGSPEHYNHIALKEVRRLDLHWSGGEIKYYDAIKIIAEQNHTELPDFVKEIISKKLKE